MEAFRRACSFLLRSAGPGAPGTPVGAARDFLTLLAGPADDPEAAAARARLEDPGAGRIAAFFARAVAPLLAEVDAAIASDPVLADRFRRLAALLDAGDGSNPPPGLIGEFWQAFCPQAAGVAAGWERMVRELRKRRTVRDLEPCREPLERPAEQVLFAANVLLTIPPGGVPPAASDLPAGIRRELERVAGEEQVFWYDHPVQVGTLPESSEILHGLVGLSEALAFEKARGRAAAGDRLQVALSVSVTHHGLQGLARDYLEEVVRGEARIRDLDLFVFTERDTTRLVEEFLRPAARAFGPTGEDPGDFAGVFGVDGPYARHYNFLKAVAALWQVTRDPGVRATFKIDLDQVFPQERLVREAGGSAFDLLGTPLWGAAGKDADGHPVELGMAAGALVNEADIGRGLFTPDVTLPRGPFAPERWIFASGVPQALSTEAEMMARSGVPGPEGATSCLSRVHVTGGTIGIRVESLRRHRPFTLSCIGRAEDQAFLMSVLHAPGAPLLRYAHVPGLIMRHDKQAFAGDAIRAAAAGKAVGDYERMLLFSHYARALPWPLAQTRAELDPFTGSFILQLPLATALLSLALRALGPAGTAPGKDGVDPAELLEVGARRLGTLTERFAADPDWMRKLYAAERRAWGAYYDILDRVDQGLREGSAEARRLAAVAREIVDSTRVAS